MEGEREKKKQTDRQTEREREREIDEEAESWRERDRHTRTDTHTVFVLAPPPSLCLSPFPPAAVVSLTQTYTLRPTCIHTLTVTYRCTQSRIIFLATQRIPEKTSQYLWPMIPPSLSMTPSGSNPLLIVSPPQILIVMTQVVEDMNAADSTVNVQSSWHGSWGYAC